MDYIYLRRIVFMFILLYCRVFIMFTKNVAAVYTRRCDEVFIRRRVLEQKIYTNL